MPEVYHGWWTPKQLKRDFGRYDSASALHLEAFTHRATSGPHRHPVHLVRAAELPLELKGRAKPAGTASCLQKQRHVKAALVDACDKPTSEGVAARARCKSDFKLNSAHAGGSETHDCVFWRTCLNQSTPQVVAVSGGSRFIIHVGGKWNGSAAKRHQARSVAQSSSQITEVEPLDPSEGQMRQHLPHSGD